MNKIISILLTSLFFTSISFAAEKEPQSLNELLLRYGKIPSISGNGEVKVDANEAEVSLVVKTKKDRFQDALANNKSIREKIREKLISANIPADNIKFSKFSSTPQFSWFSDKPSSYEISNEVKIKITLV